MRKTRRTAKVGEVIRDALVDILRRDIKDLDLGFSSITDVEVSPDLHLARVFVSGLTEDKARDAVAELQHRRGRIRSLLGQRIRLRYTPELDFKFDETSMRAGRIEDILRDVMPAGSSESLGSSVPRGDAEDEDEAVAEEPEEPRNS